MKLYKLSFGLLSVLALGSLTSCSSDPDYDDKEVINVSEGNIEYGSDGVWKKNLTNTNFLVDDYLFSHQIDEWGLAYGFTPSRVSDNSLKEPLYSFPYASASGGGIKGPGSPYIVGYWGPFLEGDSFESKTCRIWEEDLDSFQPQSIMVCCNSYLYYAVLNGTDFSKKFDSEDWVTLTAHGVHLDGTESEAQFYLVAPGYENVKDGIVATWTKFDLTDLGTCTGIYFTMESSDTEEYGINVPTYFCIDNFIVKD